MNGLSTEDTNAILMAWAAGEITEGIVAELLGDRMEARRLRLVAIARGVELAHATVPERVARAQARYKAWQTRRGEGE